MNSRPLGCESSTLTTRPWLLSQNILFISKINKLFYFSKKQTVVRAFEAAATCLVLPAVTGCASGCAWAADGQTGPACGTPPPAPSTAPAAERREVSGKEH